MRKKAADKTVITKVEEEIDRVRDEIEQEVKAKKLDWLVYWQNERKEFARKGYLLS